jgi:type I restriction enzyme, S subunit
MSWQTVNLGSVIKILSGFAFDSKKFNDKIGIPIIRIRDIKRSFSETFYNGEYDKSYLVSKGDVLIGMDGEFNISEWKGIDSLLNQRVCKIISYNEKLINKRYLLHFLPNELKYIEDKTAYATVKHLSINTINDIQIPLPPLSTQKRIAEILDAADALRRKDQELLKKYDELAQAIFIDMFGDPVKNEKGWEVKKLGDISIKIHSGNTPKGGSNVYVKKGITFFRSQNVWKNKLIYDDIAFIDDKTHTSMMKSSLKNKDILMTKTGRINTENSSLGRAALFLGEDDTANLNGHVYLIRLQNNQVHEFVVHILTTKEYRALIRDTCVGGIDKRQLNKDHIEDFPIIYPPIHSQRNFSELSNNIQIEKRNLELSAIKSEGIFNSLIQKAFNGELVA